MAADTAPAVQAEENGEPRAMNRREVAHRVFAAEFNAASVEIKGQEERAPSFVLTPLGAKVNRLYFVGVLTSSEKVKEGDMVRARVSDPTGVFTLYSGQFTPEATRALAAIEAPAFVAVVGKSRVYEPEPGRVFVSVRPESIVPVDEATRDAWVLETARRTLQRVEALREAVQLGNPTPEQLERLGFPAPVAEGASLAAQKYREHDLDPWRDIVVEALRHLVGSGNGHVAKGLPAPKTTVNAPPAPAAAAPAPPETAPGDPEAEAAVLAAVKELAAADAKGAAWDDVVARGQKQGLEAQRVEEALNALMDKGLVFEPILGRLRTA